MEINTEYCFYWG